MCKRTTTFLGIHFPVLLAVLFIHASSQLHDDREQDILIELKQYWQNPMSIKHWTPSLNSSSHCSWPEITCLNNSVTELSLRNYSINKTIPSFLCGLDNLKLIDLYYNNIPGGFPRTIYNCSKLEYLDLSENFFVGTIPDDIHTVHQLKYLNLNGNNFSGEIPASIGRLQELKTLMLSVNQFNGSFPPEIGNLSQLEVLGLAYNDKLLPSTLPSSFGKLKKMKTLWLTQTNLIGEIPVMIGDFTALEMLDLSINELTGKIPNALFLLKKLKKIALYNNKLSGEIPRVIRASSLTMIDLSGNNLTGTIPSDMGKLESLSSLVLYSNQLSGEIPESIGRISTLTDVRLFSNNLSGTLPPDFGRYSMLEGFEVASNQFTGRLPEHLCDGGKLQGLVAFDNNLTGTLPESLSDCDSLVMVDIHNNGLNGSIPSGIWTLLNLSQLMLSENSFKGELPKKVSSNLFRLEISDNRFFGKIPVEVNLWRNLSVFKASNNLLSDTIPRELTYLPSLTTLLLDQNQFHGLLPSDIISWKSLVALNLSRNQLSGQIPKAIGLLPSLSELDFSGNQFSGQIPPQLGHIRFFNLSSNHLTGIIPKEFENAAYSNSFLNNPGLCASTPNVKLGICGPRKFSILRYPQIIVWFLGTVVVVPLLSLSLILFMTKYYWRTNQEVGSSGEFTAFQTLNFTSKSIFAGLKDQTNKIGDGGSGEVYRVDLSGNNDFVAVKRIMNNKILEQQLEKQFQAEVMTLSRIKHLNIVKLMCCISSEDSKLLVYEYMEYGSLHSCLDKHRALDIVMDWPKRLHIAIGAAQGLCYMHHGCSPPIIHRDVKSSNILLDSEFNAKIADFGLAKMLVKQGEPTSISIVAGSFGYIAPEYARTRRIDEKVDVYSFGVVLLELTTGRKPNNGDENRSLAEWAQHYFEGGNSIQDALDEDIKESSHLNQMCNVFKLGIYCTRLLPWMRPCMRTIVQMLQQSDHTPKPEYKYNATHFL